MPKLRTFELVLAIFLINAPASLFAQEASATAGPSVSPQAPAKLGARQGDSYAPALSHRNPRYQVMRDDVLALTFPLSPELNQTVTVQPDGYITLANAGSLYVQELTVPEVVAAATKAYSSVLHDPIIDVDLKDFQKPFFVVSGQVMKPGQYDLRHDTTVSEAIALAGGFNPGAKTQVLLFHRVATDWVEVNKLNIKDILHGKNLNEDSHLQPGDMIFIPEKFIVNFRKYVPYTVGLYLNPTTSIF
jgi:polysaccharide biosynthesis/export protein